MIHLFAGKDDYLLRRALQSLRDRLAAGDPAALESNTTVLDGKALTPGELTAHATAAPFLAEHRLVLVDGLLRHLSKDRKGGGRKTKAKAASDDPAEQWRAALVQLQASMPESTELVFIDPDADGRSDVFKAFAAVAQLQKFDAPQEKEVPAIVGEFVQLRGLDIERGALVTLGTTLPADRWVIDMEIEKLALYAQGETITNEMISDVVSAARDSKVWDFTDALIDGEEARALAACRRMLGEGNHPQVMLATMSTQIRRLIVTRELVDEGRGPGDVMSALSISEFPAKKAIERARRYSWDDLRRMQRMLLDADLSVKRGEADDETALQLAIHRIVAVAAARSRVGRAPAGRGGRR